MTVSEKTVKDIYDKLAAISIELADLSGDVKVIKSHCQSCSKIVMGNGNKSVDSRLVTLETKNKERSKLFWFILTIAGTATAGLICTITTLIVNHNCN